MSRIVFRETLVLCVGIVIAGVFAWAIPPGKGGLHLMQGIGMPIAFCLGRAAFAPRPPHNSTVFRRTLYQVLLALALIMLLLFEMALGLFAGAKDIPAVVWAVVGSLGTMYLAFFCIAESMRTSASVEMPDWRIAAADEWDSASQPQPQSGSQLGGTGRGTMID